MSIITYKLNETLKIILPDWEGNPSINGRFIDPDKRFSGSFKKVLRWQFSPKEKAAEKKADTFKLKVQAGNSFLNQKEDCIVWLGHASFFIQLKGVRFLIDPVFGRISGIVARHSPMPCAVSDFKNIDYVLLSHAHRDHCDKGTLKKLAAQNNFTLLTSLGTGQLVSGWIQNLKFQEAGWYQQFNVSEPNLQITFLPTQHWSNRYGWDINETLWGSFMIEMDGKNIFFGGDSGYSAYTKQIAALYPSIDIAMLGVGAYTPAFMMKDAHTNPYEAVQSFHDLKAKTLIPMHYGTFDLADEPMGEPYRILKTLEQEKKINGTLKLLEVGELMKL